LFDEGIAQMRAEETGGAGDQDTLRDTLSRQIAVPLD
jgi:hypothetical protein